MGGQGRLDIAEVPAAAGGEAGRAAWPKGLPERITTIQTLLARAPKPVRVEEIARRFRRAPRGDVREVLAALVGLGLARRVGGDRYAP